MAAKVGLLTCVCVYVRVCLYVYMCVYVCVFAYFQGYQKFTHMK